MNKDCWLHDSLTNGISEQEEQKKKTKKTQETQKWADRTNDFQQNLAFALTPAPKEKHIKPYHWYDFTNLTNEKEELLAKNARLETKAQSLLNKELSPQEFEQEVDNLETFFTNANLPNTFQLLFKIAEELFTINKFFKELPVDEHLGDTDDEYSSSESYSEEEDSSDNNSESSEENNDEEEDSENEEGSKNSETEEKPEKSKESEQKEPKPEEVPLPPTPDIPEVPRPKNSEAWFTPKHWLTDEEIDWANEQILNNHVLQYEKGWWEILPAMDFMYAVNSPDQNEAQTQLLSKLSTSQAELIFIPVNNPNFHWSLLVYETDKNKFYHFDTLRGANDKYVQPLIKKLLTSLQGTDFDLKNHWVTRYEIEQGNDWDCGVAVISFTERIIQKGITANLTDLNKNFAPQRIKWLNKLNELI